MTIIKSKLLSDLLLIAITLSSVFSYTSSALASPAYNEKCNKTSALTSVNHDIHNDIPEPREISGDQNHSSAVLHALRRSGRHLLRLSDHSFGDGVIVCGNPAYSLEHAVYFYHLSIHPGDVIIRYIHDQDGEKDRSFL